MQKADKAYIVGVLLSILFLIGMLFPDRWWGVHSLAFLPTGINWLVLAIGFFLILYPKIKPFNFKTDGDLSTGIIVAIAAILAFIQYSLPIALDDYGDAFQYRQHLDQTITELPTNFYSDLFSFNLAPSGGRKTITLLYTYFSYISGVNYGVIFKWMGIIFGFGFSLSWLLFVRSYITKYKWQLILGAIGLFSPFTLIYYNHTETYAPIFFLFSLWLMGLLTLLRKKEKKWLWILLAGLVLLFKIHPITLLLLPGWIMAYITISKDDQNYLTLKKSLYQVILPIVLVGALLYFFIIRDFNDPRFLDNVKASERLFLPIVSPEAPLDRYNLLSINHILDYFNATLSWSAPVIFLIISTIILFRRKAKLTQPEILILGTTAILFILLLFMINPLVSMPMDWDLFSFPAPVLLFLLVALIRLTENLEWPSYSIPTTSGLLILTLPIFLVNAFPSMLTQRLESVGKHVYRTYYLHSNRIIITALQMDEDMNSYLDRKENILMQLKKDALPGNDPMYANLLMDDGFFFLRHSKEYGKAVNRLQEAVYYNPNQKDIQELLLEAQGALSISSPTQPIQVDPNIEKEGIRLLREAQDFEQARMHFEEALANQPNSPVYTLYLMEACFMQGDYRSAYFHATNLVKYKYPDERKALRIAVHCALEADMYAEAEIQSKLYLEKYPEDPIIDFVYHKLLLKEDLEELKLHFRSN